MGKINSAEAIRRLAIQFQDMASAADDLELVGVAEQARDEAMQARDAAFAERDGAKKDLELTRRQAEAEREAAEAQLIELDARGKDTVASAKEEAESILAVAEESAKKIVAAARELARQRQDEFASVEAATRMSLAQVKADTEAAQRELATARTALDDVIARTARAREQARKLFAE